jgi:thioredoxin-related protein
MRKKLLHVAATLYITFAIVAATQAINDRSATVARDAARDAVDAHLASPAALASMVRGKDTKLVVWSTPGCFGCKTFKRDQVPKLEAAGLAVEIKDASVTPPEDDTITAYPTIILYDGDKEIGRWIGDTKAETILAFVPEDKPEPETPPDYRIWDNRWWNWLNTLRL